MSGHVYLLEAGDHYKIGWTSGDPEERRRDLQTGSFAPIALRHQVFLRQPRAFERALHQEWEPYRAQGEWFALPEHAVRDTIRLMDDARSMGW